MLNDYQFVGEALEGLHASCSEVLEEFHASFSGGGSSALHPGARSAARACGLPDYCVNEI